MHPNDCLSSDPEVLAAVVGGNPRAARQRAERALSNLGGLEGIARSDVAELGALLGGERRARSVLAAVAFAERLARAHDETPLTLSSPVEVARWAEARIGRLEHEELWVLGLDGRSRLRGTRCVARGGLHGLGARASDVLRAALRLGASAFVLVHNHPSGDPTPSQEDVVFTARTVEASLAVGIPLLDHVVVAGSRYASVPSSEGEVIERG